ncbi:glycoside hydrolase family 64 protein [Teratosphaeria destructans]|uniref:Glycoside hydrolase family 64 protein n=1 Tax=Teratosphaeria destructans TaxID=418781 RepID=A0A9W7SWL4_9PEZI|nr:glycoside hydrolase family 64 protein [Teratosphaeria destructans]
MASFMSRIKRMLGRGADKQRQQQPLPSPPPKTTKVQAPNTQSATSPTAAAQPAGPPTVAVPSSKNPPDRPQASDRRTAATKSTAVATTASTLQVALQNQTSSSTVYAYISKYLYPPIGAPPTLQPAHRTPPPTPPAGQAINNNNAVVLIESDGKTPYYPPSPSTNGTAIGANVSIALGAPGNTVTCTIPQIAGGRICSSSTRAGLVEPSVFNPSDPNYTTNFGFCEFTYNSAQLFINISYVDFVGPPIALTLQDSSGATQHVSGMNASGPSAVASGLTAQTQKDGQPWSSLIVKSASGSLLRILSPNSGIELNPSWFSNYWSSYVDQVYAQYATAPLTVDTQASFGNVAGSGNPLNYGAGGTFAKPSAADIFSNSTGPTLLLSNNTPNGTTPSQYYTNATTNHYARILHATNLDGLGYTFPYDDVTPDGGVPQEGAVYSSSPSLLTVAVGGSNAYKS